MGIYDGVAGLEAAWQRLLYWLNVELPQQWGQLRRLADQIGAATTGVEVGPGTPPPPPPPPPATIDPFSITALPQSEQDRAWILVNSWREPLLDPDTRIDIGPWSGFTGQPTAEIAAALELHAVIWHVANGRVEVTNPQHGWGFVSLATRWYPGQPGGKAA